MIGTMKADLDAIQGSETYKTKIKNDPNLPASMLSNSTGVTVAQLDVSHCIETLKAFEQCFDDRGYLDKVPVFNNFGQWVWERPYE